MADRKTPSSSASAAKTGSSKPGSAKAAPAKPAAKRAPGKPGKSIVNQKQTPWGLIVTAALVVVFAVAVIGYAVASGSDNSSQAGGNGNCTQMIGDNKASYLNELKCASEISGVTFKAEPNRDHVQGVVKYDLTPAIGGNHSQYWADCDGTVYGQAIATENAIHSLEHGAVWITYRPGLSTSEVTALSALVNGKDRMFMSPFPGLDSPISVQSWGYQLKVDSTADPRLEKFISAVRYNKKTTPEYGATCSQPSFKSHPSTFGKPLWAPADGSTGGTMTE